MKKGLSLLCLLAMLLSLTAAMTVGTAAQKPSTLPEEIAKYRTAVYTETPPTIDGIKDAAYEKATPFYVNNAYRATVWTLWNADGLYFYAEMRITGKGKDGTKKENNISNIGFYISGVQYQFPYDENTNCTWWKNANGTEFRGNYRFQIGWTDENAAVAPYPDKKVNPNVHMLLAIPDGFEKKAIKHFNDDGSGSPGFDLEVFVPMKANDWDISKGAGQSYIGLGMVAQKTMWWGSGFTGTEAELTELAKGKKILLPSDLEPLRLIADPTTCKHEKVTYNKVATAPTLVAPGVEAGACLACATTLTREIPATAIQMLGAQTTDVVDGKYNVRFVSQIATLDDFSEVGYQITLYYGKTKTALTQGQTKIWKTGTVYSSILAGDKTETPNAEEGGKYLVAVPVTDIPVSEDIKFVKFEVTPFTVSLTGKITYAAGSGAAFTIDSGKNIETVRLVSDTTVPQLRTDPKTGKTLNLVWSDEFNGSALDSTKWNLTQETWNKKVDYTTDKKNFRLENGEAVMNLYRKEDGTYSSNKTLTTKDRMSFQYGYLEIYAKVPFSQGSCPAFWFRSAVKHRSTDTLMTEVDVFEVYKEGYVESALHKWYLKDPVAGGSTRHDWNTPISYTFPKDRWETLSDEYHLWGFGWTKDMMYMTVDGEVFATYDITDKGDFQEGLGVGSDLTGMDCFQDPLYILFSNEPGTNFRAPNWAPNDDTVFPKTFSVAWVRLYQDGTGTLYNN